MLTLNLPQRKNPIARLSLIICATLATLAWWFDTSPPPPPVELPDITDPIGAIWYAIAVLAVAIMDVARVARKERNIPPVIMPPVPFIRVPLKNAERFAILKRDNYRCQICGATSAQGVALQVDHKLAVTNGGTNDPRNLWTLCDRCNNGKSDLYL